MTDRPEGGRDPATTEELVAQYLSREASAVGDAAGGDAALEAFLAGVDPSLRDECRRQIEAATRARALIGELRATGPATAGDVPHIPGFRIDEPLGSGGMGTVYAAWDKALERRVAIKVLHRGGGAQDRILREARKVAALQHPGIVTVHSVTSEPPAIVMEHIDGDPIDRVARSLDARRKALVLRRVVRALAAAAESGVIHRDLKPQNILLTPDLEPKILDFGLALSDVEGREARRAFEGSPDFASPEQAAGEALTPASDVFSFGSVMFTVLVGRPPFGGETLAELLANIRRAEPPFPRTVASDVPEELQAVCLACMARDPADRPTAAEVGVDLGRFLEGEPVRARPALYGDILHRSIAEHQTDLGDWQTQGMISTGERDRLDLVYRRILADEDHWIVDARRLTLPQTVLYTSTWTTVVATLLLVWLARDELSSLTRWLAPIIGTLVLCVSGVIALARREVMAAGAFLAGAILAAVPAVLSLLSELGIAAVRPDDITQLLDVPFSNQQVAWALWAGLALSIVALAWVRLTGFAWTTAVLTAAGWIGLLLLYDWLDKDPDLKAVSCLPLVLLVVVALVAEARRRVRWALPFHLVALAVFVVCLDVIAVDGPTLERLGLAPAQPVHGQPLPYYVAQRAQSFSLALNGVVFVLAMLVMERSRSLDLRRGSQFMEILGPVHLLGALYMNARAHENNPYLATDASIYIGAVLVVLVLGPWRERRRFLITGLGGVALGCHLLIDLKLVDRAPFVLALGSAGLTVAVATYLWLYLRPRKRG